MQAGEVLRARDACFVAPRLMLLIEPSFGHYRVEGHSSSVEQVVGLYAISSTWTAVRGSSMFSEDGIFGNFSY